MPIVLGEATIDELQAEAMRLAEVISSATAEKNAIHKEIDTRKARAVAESKLAHMSERDREAMRHILGKS